MDRRASDSELSAESLVDDVYNDPDFNLSGASSTNDTLNDAGDTDTEQQERVVIDFIDLNKWNDVSLDPLPKRKTNSDVWNYFGILKKGDSIFIPLSKKYFCRPCFDARKFKRLVLQIFIANIYCFTVHVFLVMPVQLARRIWSCICKTNIIL